MSPQVQTELEVVRRATDAPTEHADCSYPYVAPGEVRTISIPSKRKRHVFSSRRCDECGKLSINGGHFQKIGSTEELWSALQQAYLEEHPRARTNLLDFGKAKVKSWVSSDWTCGPWNI